MAGSRHGIVHTEFALPPSRTVDTVSFDCGLEGAKTMWLLLTYLAMSIGGVIGVYFIGLAIEQAWPAASLPAFLLLFFSMLWAA